MSRPAIGVFLPTMVERAERFPDLATAARHAEDLGFESAWAVDQLVGGTGVPRRARPTGASTSGGPRGRPERRAQFCPPSWREGAAA